MAKCNTMWQNTSIVEGMFVSRRFVSFRASCILDYGHEGKHRAHVRSNVNNSVAEMEW